MEKITRRLFPVCFLIIFSVFSMSAQDTDETDYIFYISFEDDESDDVPPAPDYFGRAYTAVDVRHRYEDSGFRFSLIPLGGRSIEADVPDVLSDIFGSDNAFADRHSDDGRDIHSRIDSDFYFHNRAHYYAGRWSVFSDVFSNDLTLNIDTDGYLAIDNFKLDIARSLSFFNVFWSFYDETRHKIDDAAGIIWTHNDIRWTFCEYGGFDVCKMTPLAGTFFSAEFFGFDTGGYIGLREGCFNIGTKFGYGHKFVSVAAAADFMTDFNGKFKFQPDFLVQFSFNPVTFSFFKQSDMFYSETFLQIADFINTYRYTKDTNSVAGFYLFGDFGRISTECVAAFYSLNEDFLLLDERLSFLNPNFFSECIVTSRFNRFSLHFAGYLDGDFTPNVSVGTGVGVKEIKVFPVTLGFFCDFFTENMFSDYRLTVRTEIATDISRYFAFYIKSYNNFYCNKPEFDFYIQAGFKSFF